MTSLPNLEVVRGDRRDRHGRDRVARSRDRAAGTRGGHGLDAAALDGAAAGACEARRRVRVGERRRRRRRQHLEGAVVAGFGDPGDRDGLTDVQVVRSGRRDRHGVAGLGRAARRCGDVVRRVRADECTAEVDGDVIAGHRSAERGGESTRIVVGDGGSIARISRKSLRLPEDAVVEPDRVDECVRRRAHTGDGGLGRRRACTGGQKLCDGRSREGGRRGHRQHREGAVVARGRRRPR